MDFNDLLDVSSICEICSDTGRLENSKYCSCESGVNLQEYSEELYEWSLQSTNWEHDSNYSETQSDIEICSTIHAFEELPFDVITSRTEDMERTPEIENDITSLIFMISEELWRIKCRICEIIISCEYTILDDVSPIQVLYVYIGGICKTFKERFENLISYVLGPNGHRFKIDIFMEESTNIVPESDADSATYILDHYCTEDTYIIRKDEKCVCAFYKDFDDIIYGLYMNYISF